MKKPNSVVDGRGETLHSGLSLWNFPLNWNPYSYSLIHRLHQFYNQSLSICLPAVFSSVSWFSFCSFGLSPSFSAVQSPNAPSVIRFSPRLSSPLLGHCMNLRGRCFLVRSKWFLHCFPVFLNHKYFLKDFISNYVYVSINMSPDVLRSRRHQTPCGWRCTGGCYPSDMHVGH